MTIIWISKVLLVIVHFFWLTIYGQAGVAFLLPSLPPFTPCLTLSCQVQVFQLGGFIWPARPAPLPTAGFVCPFASELGCTLLPLTCVLAHLGCSHPSLGTSLGWELSLGILELYEFVNRKISAGDALR